MAERVVDVLEPIEIDRDQADLAIGWLSATVARLLFEQIEKGRAIPQLGQRVALSKRLDPLERFVPRHDVVEHGAADEDGADVENADEGGEHDMHDIRAQDQRERERNAREADLADRDQRPAGVAGRNSPAM